MAEGYPCFSISHISNDGDKVVEASLCTSRRKTVGMLYKLC